MYNNMYQCMHVPQSYIYHACTQYVQYVRLNALIVLHVPQPCFIAPGIFKFRLNLLLNLIRNPAARLDIKAHNYRSWNCIRYGLYQVQRLKVYLRLNQLYDVFHKVEFCPPCFFGCIKMPAKFFGAVFLPAAQKM